MQLERVTVHSMARARALAFCSAPALSEHYPYLFGNAEKGQTRSLQGAAAPSIVILSLRRTSDLAPASKTTLVRKGRDQWSFVPQDDGEWGALSVNHAQTRVTRRH